MSMSLQLFNSPGTAEENDLAIKAALDELARRGISVEEAINAAIEAGNLTTDDSDPDEDSLTGATKADKVAAWYSAEDVARQCLNEVRKQWPDDLTLIVIKSA